VKYEYLKPENIINSISVWREAVMRTETRYTDMLDVSQNIVGEC
jgi:hypothetical protein